MKVKKSIKKARKKSAGQIISSRIGCPGIKMFQLDQLKPAGYNPRVITAEAMEGLTNSLSRFGCVEPIVVNTRGRKNVIVGGNQRFEALRNLGITECLCVNISCSKADEKLLNLTLNNPLIQGDFIKKIVEYIEQLRNELPDDKDFLKLRIADLQNELGRFPGKTGLVPDDDIPRIPEKITARPGDLWVLGKHRLLCGDSTKEHMFSRLMNGQKAVLFATDPPYGVGYTGKDRPANSGKDWSDRYSDVKIEDVKKFVKSFYIAGLKHVKKNTALYFWHASERRRIIDEVCDELDILRHQQIIWVKPCIVFGFSLYAWRHEPCLLMWQLGQKPYHRKKSISIGTVWPVGYDRTGDPTTPEYYTDVWELDYDGKKRRTGEHPTIKPVEIFAIPMRVHTRTGDICYEPFCGSGSQIIAAEKLDRRCFAIEKEPVFVDVAIKRWETWTGKKAKLERKLQ